MPAGKHSRTNEKALKKHGSARSKRMKKNALLKAIIQTFRENPQTTYNYKQVARAVGLEAQADKLQTAYILAQLAADGVLNETEPGRYRLNRASASATGTFRRRSNGHHAFVPDDGGEPITVEERNAHHALDGDHVRVQLFKRRRGEPEAEVTEIVERAPHRYIGRLQVAKHYAFLVTEDRTLANDIFIPTAHLNGGRTGDKAVVRITEWPDRADNPTGEVTELLGRAGDNDTEMHAILAEYGLPTHYPENVERAARRIPRAITAEDMATALIDITERNDLGRKHVYVAN